MATILPKTLALKFDRAKKDFMASISRQVDNLFGDLLDDLQVQLEVDPQYLTNHASSPLPKKQAFSQPSKVVPTKLQKLDKTSPAIENQTADDVITTKLSETHQANGDNGYSFYIKGKTAYDLSKQIERIECMPELDSSNLIIDKDFPKMRVNGHKRPKEYRCKFEGCKKIFRHSASLNIHMRIHTGNKPYRCKWPNCHYKARQLGGITTHLRLKHFHLPKSQKEQIELGIIDKRDPREWIDIHRELL